MAALTSNSEAAGWAFVDFQPGTKNVTFNGEDHLMGNFAHYLFFERTESGIADADGAGSSALVTALTSAVRATGGSYAEDAVGPRADGFVLDDYHDALAAEAERRGSVWYRGLGRGAMAIAYFLRDNGHSILDVVSTLPVVGTPADVTNGIWFSIQGDWDSAGLSAAGVVPVLGDAVVAVAKANKAVKLLRRVNKGAEQLSSADELPKGATDLGEGVLQFENSDEFLAALGHPSPGVTYQLGSTTYRATTDGKSLAHVGGPSRASLKRSQKVKQLKARAPEY
ncbi:hypothetical protein ncot_11755 [Nocardioides sp. JQ2195]|uniref:hypothetical protein n=1 Tax=Nocardioides sp. JQ2195 TaxID=2592334 RepID=UPI00143ED05E|nr:hypothetical protein [Nocardioides sp. JQ2195]QIX27198.1 hypothetical protein ncot_11755 [Nocardioides sp. JQ2195]